MSKQNNQTRTEIAAVPAAASAVSTVSRQKTIIRTSLVGIAANVVLAAFKTIVGLAANSIAVVLDGVNNLSDALSSIITIISEKLAGKAPDKKHPFGYGRFEYMSATVVAMIVLYAGISSLVESVKNIITPQTPDYSVLSLVILAAAIVVKLFLGLYVRKKGRQVKSGSLEASGQDAFFDAILSASVLASAVIFLLFGISLEAWVGAVISLIVIRSALEMIRDSVSNILGERADKEMSQAIKATIREDPDVLGAYDLFLNDFGPSTYLGSVHVEVPSRMNAGQIDAMTRRIQENVYKTHQVVLTAVGIYSRDTGSETAMMRDDVTKLVMAHEGVLQLHGFFADPEHKKMIFDIVVAFTVKDRTKLRQEILEELAREYPGYSVTIQMDRDLSD